MTIAVQSDPEDIKELKAIFQELDRNGDGSISFEELQAGLGKRENGEQLMEILRGADTDNSGTINYTGKLLFGLIFLAEFLAATMDQQTFLKEQYLRVAFQMFDKDGSGKIDSSEISALLSGDEFRDVYTKKQLEQAIREVDGNGDGEIDFEEFVQMMKGIE